MGLHIEKREGVASATFKSQETSIAIFPKLMELLVSSLGVRVSSRKSSFSPDSKWPKAPTTRRSIPYLLPHLGEKNHERTPPISSGKGRKSDALEAVGVPLWPVCLGVCLLFMVARTNEQPPFILAFGLFLGPLVALLGPFGLALKLSREWRVENMQGNSGSGNYIRWNNLPEQSDILLVRLFWGREFRYILQLYLKSISRLTLTQNMYIYVALINSVKKSMHFIQDDKLSPWPPRRRNKRSLLAVEWWDVVCILATFFI